MAASGGSAAGLLHLLQLAGSMGEAAAREQLSDAVLDMLLGGGAAGLAASAAHGPAGAALHLNLLAVLRQCSSRAQVVQLRHALQHAVAARSSRLGGGSAAVVTAAVSGAVRLSYQRLHALCSGSQAADPAAPTGPGADSLHTSAAALFVLGPFSGSTGSEAGTCAAEAGLLLAVIRQLTAAAPTCDSCSSGDSGGWAWLLASLALGFRQLAASCSEHSSGSQEAEQPAGVAQEPGGRAAAVHALAQAALLALQALLLSPACSDAVRRGALEAALALPPAAQAPLWLLRGLGAAADSSGEPAAAEAAQLCLNPDAEGGLQLVAAAGIQHSPAADGGITAAPEASSADAQRQQVQQRALLALLELVGGMAAGCEQQRAAFLQELQAGAGRQQQPQHPQQPQQPQRQDQQNVSKAGRPLRPAAEWWAGGGQQQAGEHPQPASGSAAAVGEAAAAAPGGASSVAYMQAEDEAAKQEAAAQHFLDSLLAAADTAPACFLPLLERLAGGELGAAAPPAVQVSSQPGVA